MRIVRILCVIAAMALILSVSSFAAAPVIISQPQSYYFPTSQEFPAFAHFNVLASGENLSYQWQYKRTSDSSWTNSVSYGADTPSYSPRVGSSAAVDGSYLYRVVVSSTDGEVISDTVSVNVSTYLISPQVVVESITSFINSIVDWVASACACIIGTPLLLIGVSFFALGGSVAIISRFLSRS